MYPGSLHHSEEAPCSKRPRQSPSPVATCTDAVQAGPIIIEAGGRLGCFAAPILDGTGDSGMMVRNGTRTLTCGSDNVLVVLDIALVLR